MKFVISKKVSIKFIIWNKNLSTPAAERGPETPVKLDQSDSGRGSREPSGDRSIQTESVPWMQKQK